MQVEHLVGRLVAEGLEHARGLAEHEPVAALDQLARRAEGDHVDGGHDGRGALRRDGFHHHFQDHLEATQVARQVEGVAQAGGELAGRDLRPGHEIPHAGGGDVGAHELQGGAVRAVLLIVLVQAGGLARARLLLPAARPETLDAGAAVAEPRRALALAGQTGGDGAAAVEAPGHLEVVVGRGADQHDPDLFRVLAVDGLERLGGGAGRDAGLVLDDAEVVERARQVAPVLGVRLAEPDPAGAAAGGRLGQFAPDVIRSWQGDLAPSSVPSRDGAWHRSWSAAWRARARTGWLPADARAGSARARPARPSRRTRGRAGPRLSRRSLQRCQSWYECTVVGTRYCRRLGSNQQ